VHNQSMHLGCPRFIVEHAEPVQSGKAPRSKAARPSCAAFLFVL